MHTGKVANLIGFKIEDVYLPSMTLFFLYSCPYHFSDYSIIEISSDAVVGVGTDNCWYYFLFLVPTLIEHFFNNLIKAMLCYLICNHYFYRYIDLILLIKLHI